MTADRARTLLYLSLVVLAGVLAVCVLDMAGDLAVFVQCYVRGTCY